MVRKNRRWTDAPLLSATPTSLARRVHSASSHASSNRTDCFSSTASKCWPILLARPSAGVRSGLLLLRVCPTNTPEGSSQDGRAAAVTVRTAMLCRPGTRHNSLGTGGNLAERALHGHQMHGMVMWMECVKTGVNVCTAWDGMGRHGMGMEPAAAAAPRRPA